MHINTLNAFVFLSLWCLLILGFGFFSQYDPRALSSQYSMFQDINVMTFLGFALFASFLAKSSFISSGQALLIAVFSSVWSMFNQYIWRAIIGGPGMSWVWGRYSIGVNVLTWSNFTAVAVLVSIAVLAGRLTVTQSLVVAISEIVFLEINSNLINYRYGVADAGVTFSVWLFGAFFGLATCAVFEKSVERAAKLALALTRIESDSTSNTFGIVGTLILFCFFPSWNSYNSLIGGDLIVGNRAVTNTYLALCGSVVGAVLVSALLKGGDVCLRDVQRAVLAGGVATGTTAAMNSQCYGALIIGTFVGASAVASAHLWQSKVELILTSKDPLGVFSFIAVPAFLGAIASIILSANADANQYAVGTSTWNSVWQFIGSKHVGYASLLGYQIAALFTTIGIAIFGGVFTAKVLANFKDASSFYE